MAADESFFDQLSKGFADAVTDIRLKVVEEPMYGRAVTDSEGPAPQWPQAREPEPAQSPEQERDPKAPEPDLDR
jgi:hypothetical protein